MGRRDPGPSGNSASITAQNQWTDEVFIDKDRDGYVSASGTWVATLTLQYRLINSSTWIDRDTTTSNGLWWFQGSGKYWRFGCDTGDFTSGTATVNISG